MTNREMKHLSRGDLLEMLLELSREHEKLEQENAELLRRLEERELAIENCGSLAEAALVLNGVFEAAQAACKQYTDNVMARSAGAELRCREKEELCEQRCRAMEQETAARCEELISRAQAQADALVQEAETMARSSLEAARNKINKERETYLWLSEIIGGEE